MSEGTQKIWKIVFWGIFLVMLVIFGVPFVQVALQTEENEVQINYANHSRYRCRRKFSYCVLPLVKPGISGIFFDLPWVGKAQSTRTAKFGPRTLSRKGLRKCRRECTRRCPRKCPRRLRLSVHNAPEGPHEDSHKSAHGIIISVTTVPLFESSQLYPVATPASQRPLFRFWGFHGVPTLDVSNRTIRITDRAILNRSWIESRAIWNLSLN